MKMAQRFLSILPIALLAGPALAVGPGDAVANFKLSDQNGQAHELYRSSDKKAIVVMIQGNGCPIVRHAMHALKDIRTKYQAQGVEFLLMNSNLQDNPETIAAEAKEFEYDIPIL